MHYRPHRSRRAARSSTPRTAVVLRTAAIIVAVIVLLAATADAGVSDGWAHRKYSWSVSSIAASNPPSGSLSRCSSSGRVTRMSERKPGTVKSVRSPRSLSASTR